MIALQPIERANSAIQKTINVRLSVIRTTLSVIGSPIVIRERRALDTASPLESIVRTMRMTQHVRSDADVN